MSRLNMLNFLIIFILCLSCSCILIWMHLSFFFITILSLGLKCMLRIFVLLIPVYGCCYSSNITLILKNLSVDVINFLIYRSILILILYLLLFLLFSYRIILFFLPYFFFGFLFCSSMLIRRIVCFIIHF